MATAAGASPETADQRTGPLRSRPAACPRRRRRTVWHAGERHQLCRQRRVRRQHPAVTMLRWRRARSRRRAPNSPSSRRLPDQAHCGASGRAADNGGSGSTLLRATSGQGYALSETPLIPRRPPRRRPRWVDEAKARGDFLILPVPMKPPESPRTGKGVTDCGAELDALALKASMLRFQSGNRSLPSEVLDDAAGSVFWQVARDKGQAAEPVPRVAWRTPLRRVGSQRGRSIWIGRVGLPFADQRPRNRKTQLGWSG